MECSPRRSRSLTFDIPHVLGSSYPPAMNFVQNENLTIKDSLLAIGSKYIQSSTHACNIDDAGLDKRDDNNCEKNKFSATTSSSRSKKAILDGVMDMFGSVKSFVRKLPNVVSTLNEELSVTVVSNGDIIPSRDLYVSVPLSSNENFKINTADMETNPSMNQTSDLAFSRTSETSRASWRFLSGVFTKQKSNLPHKKFLSVDNIYRQTWNENTNHDEDVFVDVAFEAACEESIGNNLFSGNTSIDTETKILVTQFERIDIGGADFDLGNLSCPINVPETKNVEMIQKESLEIPKSIVEETTSIKCEFTSRTRQISECSVESDDSFIVFEKSSVSEHCSISGEDDENDDSDNDSYSKFTIEFTSKSDFRSRRYSESSDDSDDFIVFNEGSPAKCPDYFPEFEIRASKVRFDPSPLIHTMIKWNYAYRAARKGPWEEMARDRERFRGRINSIARIINPILTADHRQSIWKIRFDIQD